MTNIEEQNNCLYLPQTDEQLYNNKMYMS